MALTDAQIKALKESGATEADILRAWKLSGDAPATETKGFGEELFSLENTGKNLGNTVSGLYNLVRHPIDTGEAIIESLGTNKGWQDALAIIPGTKTAGIALGDFAKREWHPDEYGRTLNEELTGAAVAAGLSAARPVAKLAGPAAADALQWTKSKIVGIPEDVRLAQEANRVGIFANKQNIPKGTTPVERQALTRLEEYEPTFVQMNPLQGIDPKMGIEGWKQYEAKLRTIEQTSTEARKGILTKASEAELQKGSPGIGLDDLQLSGQDAYGNPTGFAGMSLRMADTEPVNNASMFLQQQFGTKLSPTDTGLRNVGAKEATDILHRIDDEIRTWGGYDDNTLAAIKKNPSYRDNYISALKFARGQLKEAIQGHLQGLNGSGFIWAENTDNIGMAINYQKLAERFRQETGEAFTPSSAKAAIEPGQGLLNSGWANKAKALITPDSAKRSATEMAGIAREQDALRQMQVLMDYRRQLRPTPIPRDWASIRASAVQTFKISALATQMGLVLLPEQLSQIPEAQAEPLVAAVASTFPGEFEPIQENYKTVVNGKILDPMERDMHKMKALDLEPGKRAQILGALFDQGKYVPIATPAPVPPMPEPLERLKQLQAPAPQASQSLDSSIDRSGDEMLQKLLKSESNHVILQ